MSRELSEVFQKYVEKYFSFLVDSGKFKGPYLVRDGPLTVEVGYAGDDVSIVLILDIRDGIVDCQVRPLIGTMPAPYGEGYQEYLPILLWRKGIPRKELKIVLQRDLPLTERVREQVKQYALLFKRYGVEALREYRSSPRGESIS